jgi:hypothetical protein
MHGEMAKMKLRTGFVSNSSSSSFVIPLDSLTGKQVKQIVSHQIKGKKMGIRYAKTDPWTIEVTDTEVRGSTWMDNFDMEKFLRQIGVPDDIITWAEFRAWEK